MPAKTYEMYYENTKIDYYILDGAYLMPGMLVLWDGTVRCRFDRVLLSWVILVLNGPTCKQGMSSIILCRTELGTEGRSTDNLQGPCRIAAGDGWMGL
jgi:hypothetical protein